MQGRGLLLALTIVATACSPLATDQRTLEPVATVTPSTSLGSSPTPTAAPSTSSSPSPTPVARTISGRATLQATGAGVAGVVVRGMPSPINDGRVPGPDVTATTDDRGAYTFTIVTWTPEALANSSSFQMMVQVTPPPGLLVLGVTKTMGAPPGTAGGPGNLTGALFVDDLSGPIDITLGPGHIVEGRITSGQSGTAVAGVGVAALGTDSILIYGGQGDAFAIAATGMTDANGRYMLTVPSGTYVIHTPGAQGAQPRFWSDDPAVFQASPLKVERNVGGIDIAVFSVTQIGGYVRSGPTFGDGVQGARVAAYLSAGTPCCRTVGVATSGYNGTFLMHLPPGTYRFVFDPPTGSPYAAQWWRAAAGFATATDVVVGPDRVQLEVELARRAP
jgi:hypothetical protein